MRRPRHSGIVRRRVGWVQTAEENKKWRPAICSPDWIIHFNIWVSGKTLHYFGTACNSVCLQTNGETSLTKYRMCLTKTEEIGGNLKWAPPPPPPLCEEEGDSLWPGLIPLQQLGFPRLFNSSIGWIFVVKVFINDLFRTIHPQTVRSKKLWVLSFCWHLLTQSQRSQVRFPASTSHTLSTTACTWLCVVKRLERPGAEKRSQSICFDFLYTSSKHIRHYNALAQGYVSANSRKNKSSPNGEFFVFFRRPLKLNVVFCQHCAQNAFSSSLVVLIRRMTLEKKL